MAALNSPPLSERAAARTAFVYPNLPARSSSDGYRSSGSSSNSDSPTRTPVISTASTPTAASPVTASAFPASPPPPLLPPLQRDGSSPGSGEGATEQQRRAKALLALAFSRGSPRSSPAALPPLASGVPPSFPTPSPPVPPCPPALLSWLSALLQQNGPVDLQRLSAKSLFQQLQHSRVHNAPSAPLHRCADGLVDVFVDYSKRRCVGQLRDGVFSGFMICFLSNRGMAEVGDDRPADYEYKTAQLSAEEQLQPGEPTAVVASVRPVFIKGNGCHQCGSSFALKSRHHCRSCGHAFCERHSGYRLLLLRLYYPLDVPQKVCDSCYAELTAHAMMMHGDVYIGQWRAERMQGWGCFISSVEGRVYCGSFEQDDRTGAACIRIHKPCARLYRGAVFLGQPQGTGKMLYYDPHDFGAAADVDALQQSAFCPWSDQLHDEDSGQPVCAVYCGQWVNGIRSGPGVLLTWRWRYSGQFVDDQRTGDGCLVWANHDSFRGTLLRNQRHGRGVQHTAATGQVYTGDFALDEATGTGQTQYGHGSRYTGLHVKGLPDGNGVMAYAPGCVYKGGWAQGRRHGFGQLDFGSYRCRSLSDGTLPLHSRAPPVQPWLGSAEAAGVALASYAGDWQSDVPNGSGRLSYADGTLYEGAVVCGRCTDESARTHYRNGDDYAGAHVDGFRHGAGTYIYSASGNKCCVGWTQGRRSGSLVTDTVVCKRKAELYVGFTSYAFGRWFAADSEAEQSTRQQPTFASPCDPDIPVLARHGTGILRRPSAQGVKKVQSEWEQDLQIGRGCWTLQGAVLVQGDWRIQQTDAGGRSSGLSSPATIDVPPINVTTAVLSFCLVPTTPAPPCQYLAEVCSGRLAAVADMHAAMQRRVSLSPSDSATRSAVCLPPLIALAPSVAMCLNGFCHVRLSEGEEWRGLMLMGRAEGLGQWDYVATDGERVSCSGWWRRGRKDGAAHCRYGDAQEFSGSFRSGRRHGQGQWRITQPQQLLYQGLFDGKPHGVGRVSSPALSYAGEIVQGAVRGFGSCRCSNGAVYDGQWRDGLPHGSGRLSNAVSSYAGQMELGHCTGKGRIDIRAEADNGSRWLLAFEGDVQDGQLQGVGSLALRRLDANGGSASSLLLLYRGGFHNQRFHGLGTASLYHCSQPLSEALPLSQLELALQGEHCASSYSGTWLDGRRHGYGRLVETQRGGGSDDDSHRETRSVSYEGTFVQDERRGFARIFRHGGADLQSGVFMEYEGGVDGDSRCGYGSSLLSDGSRFTGSYQQDRQHGFGVHQLSTGDQLTGRWREGRKCGAARLVFSQDSSSRNPLAGLHSVLSVECQYRDELLHGPCTFFFSRTAPFPILSLTMVLDAGSLSSLHSFKVALRDTSAPDKASTVYTGELEFRLDQPKNGSSEKAAAPVRDGAFIHELLTVSSAIAQALQADRCADQTAGVARLHSLLPGAALRSACSPASLLGLAVSTGSCFPLYVMSCFLCHTRCSRQGIGRMVKLAGGDEYSGGWKRGDKTGLASWKRREVFAWAGPIDGGEADGRELGVYTGMVVKGCRQGAGRLLLPQRGLAITASWHADAPVWTAVMRIDDYSACTRYVGSVKPGLLYDGYGQLQHLGVAEYWQHTGHWKDGLAEGPGLRVGSLGRWLGQFHDGRQHGEGKWEGKDGTEMIGVWEKDRAVSVVPVTAPPVNAQA